MQELGKNNYGQMSLDGFIKKKSQWLVLNWWKYL